ncbi:MAG: metal-dependent hydrolase [Candidatus Desulfatibia sp.]|uniref:metal-dependent hydrolase n=1 Tax=Candidatus Desulfatibia sp. TaxID=3101189 RepID=UPI002F2D3B18
MPGYKGHLTGRLIFWGLCLAGLFGFGIYQPDPITALVLLLIVLLGALFPDTDTDSKGQNLFYGCLVILDLALMIKGKFKWAAILGFCALLPAIGHHRGWTHTWWAMLIIPLPIIILPMMFYKLSLPDVLPFYLAAVFGYLSHLVLDRKF